METQGNNQLEGYNFFRPLCSEKALPLWKGGVAKKGSPGQMIWSEEEQKWKVYEAQ